MAEDGIRTPDLKRPKLEADGEADTWKVDANLVLGFHFLDPDQEPHLVDEGSSFPAGMCHQHFGPDEMITGYQGLAVDVWFSQRSYLALAEVRSKKRQDGADDVYGILQNGFPAGLAMSRGAYQSSLEDAPDDLGIDSLGEPVLERQLDADTSLLVHRVELCKATQNVKDLHARFQPLLLFFVDGASFINPEEPGWELLSAVLVRKGKGRILAGLATLYRFYCWPDRTRLRVSQVLVPPPQQGKGIGRALLEAAYLVAEACSAVDVTYEDPTEDLQTIRERVELRRAVKLPWLMELAAKVAQAAASALPANGHAQESNDAAGQEASSVALNLKDQTRAQASLRVTKQQVRKLWEVLLRAQPPLAGEAGARMLRTLVQARLVSGVTSTRRVAEGKRIVEFPENGFMMAKVPRDAALSAGMPIAMEGEGAEGESAEVREAALEEAVAKRMEQLDALVAVVRPHMQ